MTTPYIVGAAMTPFGKHRASSYAGLAVPPLLEAIRVAGVDRAEIGAVYCSQTYGGLMVGQRICKEVGIGGIPIVNVENACSGGATALNEACEAIRSGRHEVVVVIGVEKLTQFSGGTLPLPTEDREAQTGMVMPAVYAMRARRYLFETGANVEDFARVSVKARSNGARNPYAQMRMPVSIPEVLKARPIADPLTLLMCCPTGDGAAVVIVASEAVRQRLGGDAVAVRASVIHSGIIAEGYRDMIDPAISRHSAQDAFAQAGLGPDDIDVVELHDAFSSAEIVYYEALGFAAKGAGFELIRSGATELGGSLPVNPSGGLLAKGHPVGASGVAQAVEMFWQLLGRAGDRQVRDARIGMSHVTGGGVAGLDHGACTIHIYEGVRR